MINFKKQFLLMLFILSAGLFAAGSASAQTWTAVDSANTLNPCMSGGTLVGFQKTGQCQCNSGYSYGRAVNANCTMDGFIPGCWNPNSGTCNTCGSGGTVLLGAESCFNNGQSSQGGSNPSAVGTSCTGSSTTILGASTQCISSGTTSGGNSTN